MIFKIYEMGWLFFFVLFFFFVHSSKVGRRRGGGILYRAISATIPSKNFCIRIHIASFIMFEFTDFPGASIASSSFSFSFSSLPRGFCRINKFRTVVSRRTNKIKGTKGRMQPTEERRRGKGFVGGM